MSAAVTIDRAEKYLDGLPPLLITHVSHEGVDAVATDSRGNWRVTWCDVGGWACSCPAKSTACGHIGAVRQIVVLDVDQADTAEQPVTDLDVDQLDRRTVAAAAAATPRRTA